MEKKKEGKTKTIFISELKDIKNKEEILKNCVTLPDLNEKNLYGHCEVIEEQWYKE